MTHSTFTPTFKRDISKEGNCLQPHNPCPRWAAWSHLLTRGNPLHHAERGPRPPSAMVVPARLNCIRQKPRGAECALETLRCR